MPAVSSHFWEQCQLKEIGRDATVRRLRYGGLGSAGVGSYYLDDRIDSLVRLKQTAEKPVFPDFRAGIANKDLAMNHLVSSNWIGQDMHVDLGFRTGSGTYETINLFTGFGREIDGNQTTIEIQAEGKFAHLSRDKVGATGSPLIFVGSDWNPADLFWTAVTCYGGLDTTTSDANEDIDYDAWDEWRLGAITMGITVQGKMEGDDLLTWIQAMAEIGDAWIFESEARLSFNFFTPTHPDSYSPISINEKHYNKQPKVQIRDQVATVEVFNRFDPTSKVWIPASPVIKTNSDAAATYGSIIKRYDSELVWHSTSKSAAQFAGRKDRTYSAGIKRFNVDGDIPLWPFGLGDRVLFTCGSWGVNAATYQVAGREIDAESRRTRLDLESAESWSQWFFLDDATYGLLDEDYNPLY